ncbi:hypothetical protein [Bacillus alkalisoli]|uniref:hypothetical protein n=1 Tax=Bacillus alkalisoli TaxID=2011008 RepID=UPI000C235C36|nr:hypothetical protein [Bacillus alkalisoli]
MLFIIVLFVALLLFSYFKSTTIFGKIGITIYTFFSFLYVQQSFAVEEPKTINLIIAILGICIFLFSHFLSFKKVNA